MILEKYRHGLDGFEATLTREALAREVTYGPRVEMPLGDLLRHYSVEVRAHTWDLAQATGRDIVLEPELVQDALETAEAFAAGARRAGMLGFELPVPDGADDQTRLLARLGRRT
jgi:uncharacterized protein (TIGR03086 family)